MISAKFEQLVGVEQLSIQLPEGQEGAYIETYSMDSGFTQSRPATEPIVARHSASIISPAHNLRLIETASVVEHEEAHPCIICIIEAQSDGDSEQEFVHSGHSSPPSPS
mmetsp:Transcript_23741/g.28640  ORF Transcript_23741/g.28640 Transcript_23741/m.28640 type:complete len:109 (+) Transcript_23741:952-1278(+)